MRAGHLVGRGMWPEHEMYEDCNASEYKDLYSIFPI